VQLDDERSRRTVADGREFEIVKRWYEPEELERELAARGWRITVGRTANGLFLVGSGD
jgi:hypothetical protein